MIRTAVSGAAAAALLALYPSSALAHGDADLPRYVAAGGEDRGDCSDAAQPCRSLGYALRQAGKGTPIRVADGRYPVAGAEDLFLVVSGVVDVTGGYDRASGFRAQSAERRSVLTGVPPDYRQALAARGFHVIADSKADAGGVAEATGRLLALHRKVGQGVAAGTCTGGSVDGLPCANVDLLAQLRFDQLSARPSGGNDVWGFVDLNSGREYVIAGFNLGTAVIDVSDPAAPREVGFVDGQDADWRDIKVYQHYDAQAGRYRAYAYVTTDGSSDGLFVVDLGGLPHRVSRLPYPSQFSAAHNVYGAGADFATGLPLTDNPRLIVAGSSLGAGQYRAYSLADPAAPQYIVGSDVGNSLPGGDSSYMHDAASLLISDARAATCPNATTVCELLLDFNEQKFEIWDITDITDPVQLTAGNAEYPQRGYVHSGWWSEDRQFAFVHDELDEQRFGANTTLRVFSLANLAAPQLVATWTGPTPAIDHNGYVRGNRYYMSNYARGLTVLDISDPANPQAVGLLDTHPVSDNRGFFGAWGAYPFLPSGTLAISDMNNGLFLARDRSLDVPQGRLSFAAAGFAVAEGQVAVVGVQRSGGSSGSATVDIETVHATAGGDDYVLQGTTLAWADGDASPKSVDVAAIADGVDEGAELLLLRLVNPTGGATLGDVNLARLTIADPGAQSTLTPFEETIEIAERGFATAVVVVTRGGSAAGAASVDWDVLPGSADAADYTGASSGTLSWADGDGAAKWLELAIVDDGVFEDEEDLEVRFSNASGATLAGATAVRVVIQNGSGVNLGPNAVVGSSQVVAEGNTVTLDGSASNDPNGDALAFSWAQVAGPPVTLSSSSTATTQFTAPAVDGDTLLRFRLTVTDPGGLSDTINASVTVTDRDGGSGGGAAHWLLLLALAAGLRAIRRGGA